MFTMYRLTVDPEYCDGLNDSQYIYNEATAEKVNDFQHPLAALKLIKKWVPMFLKIKQEFITNSLISNVLFYDRKCHFVMLLKLVQN